MVPTAWFMVETPIPFFQCNDLDFIYVLFFFFNHDRDVAQWIKSMNPNWTCELRCHKLNVSSMWLNWVLVLNKLMTCFPSDSLSWGSIKKKKRKSSLETSQIYLAFYPGLAPRVASCFPFLTCFSQWRNLRYVDVDILLQVEYT